MPTTLEIWGMKLEDFMASMKGKRIKKAAFYNRTGTLHTVHREAVDAALQLGKPVPDEVKAEYPRLVEKYTFGERLIASRRI